MSLILLIVGYVLGIVDSFWGYGILLALTVVAFGFLHVFWSGRRNRYMPCDGKAVLITGCDTGLGYGLAVKLHDMGATVFAGCLDVSSAGALEFAEYGSGRIHVIQLDVTKEEQIKALPDYIKRHSPNGELWGVVNNAGIDCTFDIDNVPLSSFRHVAEVNLFGMINVTKTLLPLVIKSKGRIVNVTSVKGRLAIPYTAAYTITKFGGEAFSDILRLEMQKWGVKVSIIEPGIYNVATRITSPDKLKADADNIWSNMDVQHVEDYGKEYVYHSVHTPNRIDENNPTTPTVLCSMAPVTTAMVHALFAVHPKSRYMIGGRGVDKFVILIHLQRLVPTWLMDWLLHYEFDGMFPLPTKLRR